MKQAFTAGSGVTDITPSGSMFLFGYPHVARYSTGVHDPLLAAALYLESAGEACFFISADVIFVSKATTARVRDRVTAATGVPAKSILISASHTHSGPSTVDYASNAADPTVPPVDPTYLAWLEEQLAAVAIQAWASRRPAEIAITSADATGAGTNRHDPSGPSDLTVPVLSVREPESQRPIALLLICAMHPTVLHEDSTLYSGDFPADARAYLQSHVVGPDCPILYHTGASGNQSPRHVTRGNTFAEAKRLGEILGQAVERSLGNLRYEQSASIRSRQAMIDLPRRAFPSLEQAEEEVRRTKERLLTLSRENAPATAIRTAECDIFGAEETLTLVRAAASGTLDQALQSCLPAEIAVLAIGGDYFIGWPGEFFVEFAMEVRKAFPKAHLITLANGELQGYVVTQQAVDAKWYEANNALLESPRAGHLMVQSTLKLLEELR